jgi:cysteine desulfurase
MKTPIYLDNHATTPIDPLVLEAMMPSMTSAFGNAASRTHSFGREAEKIVENGRRVLAEFVGAEPKDLIFTSGTTESDNMALKGIADMYRDKGNHIITQATEHKAVLDSCKFLERQGFQVTYLPVDGTGRISMTDLENAVTDETILISIMFANNEVGTIQPIEEIGHFAKEHKILFHCDAAQGAGKIPINVDDLGIDVLCFSAHKMYGPKGIGATYVRRQHPRVSMTPLIHGGGHERGLRSGTLNVPLVAGFAKAAELASSGMAAEEARIASLRDKLQKGLESELGDVVINGCPEHRLSMNLNMSFPYLDGADLLTAITEEIAVSSGSACTSASNEPSFVLRALGVSEEVANTSVRFGIGRFTTEEEIDYTNQKVSGIVKDLRENSPVYQAAKK